MMRYLEAEITRSAVCWARLLWAHFVPVFSGSCVREELSPCLTPLTAQFPTMSDLAAFRW